MVLRNSECPPILSQLFSIQIIRLRKASERRSNKNHSVWMPCVNLAICFISRREKRQKIEDIKKNIRDAILVRLAYLQSTTHI